MLDALERMAGPGVSTGDLDRAAARIFARLGAQSAPALVYGFPGTVLISVNDEIVHGVPGARHLSTADGSLAAHYGHTVVITRDRPVLLTAA